MLLGILVSLFIVYIKYIRKTNKIFKIHKTIYGIMRQVLCEKLKYSMPFECRCYYSSKKKYVVKLLFCIRRLHYQRSKTLASLLTNIAHRLRTNYFVDTIAINGFITRFWCLRFAGFQLSTKNKTLLSQTAAVITVAKSGARSRHVTMNYQPKSASINFLKINFQVHPFRSAKYHAKKKKLELTRAHCVCVCV